MLYSLLLTNELVIDSHKPDSQANGHAQGHAQPP